jgi:hypothetical protein
MFCVLRLLLLRQQHMAQAPQIWLMDPLKVQLDPALVCVRATNGHHLLNG